ncbi:EamA family transporter, partial [Poseidonibacter sp.]|uniref:EamA family transporter n=1 Tax=Poseidonibacter sp. TaxID=2321188 RepID=UPI003C75DE66
MKSQSLAYKYALIAIFFWSTVASAFKISLKYLSAYELVLYASLTSTFILLLVVLYQKKINEVKTHI